MTDSEIKASIEAELDKAEKLWKAVKDEFILEKAHPETRMMGDVSTKIPGFPTIKVGKPEVADFIALVLDVRGSTSHLLQAISGAKASQLERVLYETTAMNTAGVMIIENYNGGVTELLGDGFLALFKQKGAGDTQCVYDAHNAAKKCMSVTKEVVNDILKSRYQLPPLNIGIGMAYSKAIVTVMGTGENLHPKALGECVYRATKLSDGMNEICIDDRLHKLWPTSKDGILKFLSFSRHNINGYTISKNY